MEMHIPIKKDKIKTSHEYVLLDKLKKLAFLFSCPECNYDYYCCDRCGNSNGYLLYKMESEDYPTVKNKGGCSFLNKGKGCTLPLNLRSVTCITHICKERKAKMDKDLLEGLDALTQYMRRLEHKISIMEAK